MHFFLKDEQYYAIINTSTGVWYNGSIGVSKTFDGSSILSAPANLIIKQIFAIINDCSSFGERNLFL